jgi:GTP-binding protein LepA
MAQGTEFDAEEIGVMSPARTPIDSLSAGEVGYVITGLKDVSRLRVGDTLTSRRRPADEPLPATRTSSRWSSPGSSRPTPTTTRSCATRSSG